jgi:hypothetical protein
LPLRMLRALIFIGFPSIRYIQSYQSTSYSHSAMAAIVFHCYVSTDISVKPNSAYGVEATN